MLDCGEACSPPGFVCICGWGCPSMPAPPASVLQCFSPNFCWCFASWVPTHFLPGLSPNCSLGTPARWGFVLETMFFFRLSSVFGTLSCWKMNPSGYKTSSDIRKWPSWMLLYISLFMFPKKTQSGVVPRRDTPPQTWNFWLCFRRWYKGTCEFFAQLVSFKGYIQIEHSSEKHQIVPVEMFMLMAPRQAPVL